MLKKQETGGVLRPVTETPPCALPGVNFGTLPERPSGPRQGPPTEGGLLSPRCGSRHRVKPGPFWCPCYDMAMELSTQEPAIDEMLLRPKRPRTQGAHLLGNAVASSAERREVDCMNKGGMNGSGRSRS